MGVIPNKTLREAASPEMATNRHFWRGFFDGDGSIYKQAAGDFGLSLAGSDRIIHQFVDFAHSFVQDVALNVYPHSGCKLLQYCIVGGTYCVRRVADLLYDDASIFLDRKMEIYRALVAAVPEKYRLRKMCFKPGCGKVVKECRDCILRYARGERPVRSIGQNL
jgi:hypothetical protein